MSSRTNRLVIIPPEILNAPMRTPNQTMPLSSIPPSSPTTLLQKKREVYLQRRPYILFQVEQVCSNVVNDLDVYHVLNSYNREAEEIEDYDLLNSAIFKKMLENPRNAVPICKYMFLLGRDPVKGQISKNSFFKLLEKYYLDRENIITNHGVDAYKNFVWFFAAATHHNRNIFLAPFEDLISGILVLLDSLRILIDTSQDIKLLCLLITRFAQYCQMPNIEKKNLTINALSPVFLDIKNTVRTHLSKANINNLDQKVIICLMMALEDSIRFDMGSRNFYTDIVSKEDIIDFLPDVLQIQIPLADINHHYDVTDVSSIINYV